MVKSIRRLQFSNKYRRLSCPQLAQASHCSGSPLIGGAMKTRTLIAALAAIFIACIPVGAGATSRIKDLASVEGVRQNQLIGYGLVVGLNGTGDTLNNIP